MLSRFVYRLPSGDEKHVPGPTPELRAVCVPDLRTVSEAVAVIVRAFRLLVIEVNRLQPQLGQRVQLARLRDAVMVCVPPQT